MAGVPWQDLVRPVNWDEVGLWNAPDQQEPEEETDPELDWRSWKEENDAFDDLHNSNVNTMQMDHISKGSPRSLSPLLGDEPSVMLPGENDGEEEGISYDSSNLGLGDLAPASASFPPVSSSGERDEYSNRTLYVQLGRCSRSFPTVEQPFEPKVHVEVPLQGEFPSDMNETLEEAPLPVDVPLGGDANTARWIPTPEGRGKSVVRRGRQRPWSSEGREASRKRIKLDLLYDDSSPTAVIKECLPTPEASPLPLMNPLALKESDVYYSADGAHETTILAPELLAQLGSHDASNGKSGEPSSEKIEALTPLKTKENNWGCNALYKVRNRRCNRGAINGMYCEKHWKLGDPLHVHQDLEVIPSNLCMARFRRVENRRCTHPVAEGSIYCSLHAHVASGDFEHEEPHPRPNLKEKDVSEVERVTPNFAERSISMNRCSGITLHGSQCTHNVKDGAMYCMKHLGSDGEHHQKAEHSMPNGNDTNIPSDRGPSNKPLDGTPSRCNGRTLHGTQCTHNVKEGAGYCMKHADQAGGTPVKQTEAKASQVSQELGPPTGGNVQSEPSTVLEQSATPIVLKEAQVETLGPRCLGRTRRTDEQCSFRPKAGSLYCERHSRVALQRGLDNNVTNEELSGSLLVGVASKEKNGLKERKSQSKAKELFNEFLNAGLSNGKAASAKCEDIVDYVVGEASKDVLSGETVLGLVSTERERLHKLLIEQAGLTRAKPELFWGSGSSLHAMKTYLDVMKASLMDIEKRNLEGKEGQEPTSFMKLLGSDSALPSSKLVLPSDFSTGCIKRQGTQGDMESTLTCGLCNEKFPSMTRLGRHWKEEHKKEASLFQKGVACSVCGQEYTNRGGLLRHWKSTHASIPMVDPCCLVCVMCDKKFNEFALLWKHVEEQHALQFSSQDFARQVSDGILGARTLLKCSFCGEGFDSHWNLHRHKESAHLDQLGRDPKLSISLPDAESPSKGTVNSDEPISPHKFKCRFCGQRFNLLPDLGRHHQAEHRKPNQTAPGRVLSPPLLHADIPPIGKRTPLPHPESGNSPPGKMMPLSELSNSPPRKLMVWKKEETRNIELTMDPPVTVEWPLPGPVAAGTPSQGVNSRKWKTLAREKGKNIAVAPPLVTVAPKRRRKRKRTDHLQNGKLVPVKKKPGCAKQIVQHMKAVKQIQEERHGLDPSHKNGFLAGFGNFKAGVNSSSKMLPQRTSKNDTWPTSAELLDAARVACCKDSLYHELAKRHTELHPQLYMQAAILCTAMKVDVQWHLEGFVCSNNCSPFHAVELPIPALEVDMAGFSETPFKSHAGYADVELLTSPLESVVTREVVKSKHIVLYEDLSNGQEPVPVPCVVDEDVMRPCSCLLCRDNSANSSTDSLEPWNTFSYTNKRLLDPSLGLDTESSKLGCSCGDSRCYSLHCDHVSMFDHDNVEARDIQGNPLQGRFPYDNEGRIILEEGYMVYECNSSCQCQDGCQNRVLQKGVRVKLEVFKTRHKGWAVRTAEPIARGTFVCEYIGEVLNDQEANKRGERYDEDGCSYLYDIDAHLDMTGSRAGAKLFVIDATKHGNVARFINHSCAPNLVNYEVLVESMDCQLAHIGFFAKRDIAMGEELAYNYRYKLLPGKGCACHCGATGCRGRLY